MRNKTVIVSLEPLPNLRIPSDIHLSHFRPSSSSIYTGDAIFKDVLQNSKSLIDPFSQNSVISYILRYAL